MSRTEVQDWLLSHNNYEREISTLAQKLSKDHQAFKLSVTSGKGGVGKTSISVKLGKMLAEMGHRVLLLDCDYNLSNTRLKLGIPVTNNFFALISAQKDFGDCLYKDGNFHLLSGCNGNPELFENGIQLDKLIIDIIVEHEKNYDFILLDCPAGISKETLTLNAYCNMRVVVVTPDKSSVTDSYSLVKLLKSKYGVNHNHLLANKTSTNKQYQKMVKVFSETIEQYVGGRINILGQICKENQAVDMFDRLLLDDESSELHNNFVKVVEKIAEEGLSFIKSGQEFIIQEKERSPEGNLGIENLI